MYGNSLHPQMSNVTSNDTMERQGNSVQPGMHYGVIFH